MDNGRLKTLKSTVAIIKDMGDEHKESIPRRVYVRDVGDLVDAFERYGTALENIRDCKDYECCEDLMRKARRALIVG